ncbi:MAG: hypothetical protein QW594_03295 [Candidatus Woesearchaeota archaeon]
MDQIPNDSDATPNNNSESEKSLEELVAAIETITPNYTFDDVQKIIELANDHPNGFPKLQEYRSTLVVKVAKDKGIFIKPDKELKLYQDLVRAAQFIDYPNISSDEAFSKDLKKTGLLLQKYFFSVESMVKLPTSYHTFDSLLDTAYAKISGYSLLDVHLPLLLYISHAADKNDPALFTPLKNYFLGDDTEFFMNLATLAKAADWYLINFPHDRQKFPKGKAEQLVFKYQNSSGSPMNN